MASPVYDTSIFALREVSRVREPDYDLEAELSHNAPQALLRDLHRVAKSFGVNPLEFDKHERPTDAGRKAVVEMKSAIYASYRVPIHELFPIRAWYHETIAERRRILALPWGEAPKFGPQYLPGGMSWSGS